MGSITFSPINIPICSISLSTPLPGNDQTDIFNTEQSMINLGGDCFLILARKNNDSCYRQFLSTDCCNTWIDQGNTAFDTWDNGLNNQAPPFLAYINYEGVGIVVCYYTIRKCDSNLPPYPPPPQPPPPNAPVLRVVFGLAKDIINGPSRWKQSTINEIYNYSTPVTKPGGYQSFIHPLNQYKGIGITFEEDHTNFSPAIHAYPKIVFTNDKNTNPLGILYKDFITILGFGYLGL